MRLFISFLLTLQLFGQTYQPIAEDGFTTAVTQTLETRPNWVNMRTIRVMNNHSHQGGTIVGAADGYYLLYRWSGPEVFNADQYSQLKVTQVSIYSTRSIGVAVRISGATDSGNAMMAYCDKDNCMLRRVNSGSVTNVRNWTPHGQTVPFWVRLEAQGEDYRLSVGSAPESMTELFTEPYSGFASGVPGVSGVHLATYGDDWQGGNIVEVAGGQDLMITGKTITDYASPPGLASGTPDGSYALSSAESIDMFSGRLNYELPLVHVGGRGSAGYTMSLKIPSKWTASVAVDCSSTQNFGDYCAPEVYYATFGDYQSSRVGYGPGVMMLRRSGVFGCLDTNAPTPQIIYGLTTARTTVIFVDSRGTEHELFDAAWAGEYKGGVTGSCLTAQNLANRGKIFVAKDGGALTFVSDESIADITAFGTTDPSVGGRLFFPDGTMYRINHEGRVVYIRDRHGNLTTFEYSASEPKLLTRVTDSEGRQVNISYDQTQDTITYSTLSGSINSITVAYANLQTRLRSDQGGAVVTYNQLFNMVQGESTFNPVLPASVSLPNGRQYQFRYNLYAELAELVLPTGGRFEYDWGGGDDGSPANGYIAQQDLAIISRSVKQRSSYTASSGGTVAAQSFFVQGALGEFDSFRERHDGSSGPGAVRVSRHGFYSYRKRTAMTVWRFGGRRADAGRHWHEQRRIGSPACGNPAGAPAVAGRAEAAHCRSDLRTERVHRAGRA